MVRFGAVTVHDIVTHLRAPLMIAVDRPDAARHVWRLRPIQGVAENARARMGPLRRIVNLHGIDKRLAN